MERCHADFVLCTGRMVVDAAFFLLEIRGQIFGLSQRASGQSFKAQEGISVRFAALGNKMDKRR